MSYQVQSLKRGIDILRALSDGPRTVTEIARETELAKGTAFRLLASLAYQQFVVRETGGSRYTLGPGLLPLLENTHSTFGWVGALVEAPLRELRAQTVETVVVHIRLGTQRVCVEELASTASLRYVATVGATVPIHVGSAGKVLLACMPQDGLAELLSHLQLEAVTDRSITDLATLHREIELTRRRGWATSAGERIAGSSSLSVPVALPNGRWASLSVLGPADRLTNAEIERLLPLAKRTATKMERLLTAGEPAVAE